MMQDYEYDPTEMSPMDESAWRGFLDAYADETYRQLAEAY